MKSALLIGVILLASSTGAASAATRGECAGRCIICGDDPVCVTIYENCLDACVRESSGPAVRVRPVRFVAIAVSESTLRVGYAFDFATLQEAKQAALNQCIKIAKVSDCKVAVSAKDDVCIAIAISGPGVAWGAAWGTNADIAHTYALAECRQGGGTACFIKQTVCPD
jgi:hypothetical protein